VAGVHIAGERHRTTFTPSIIGFATTLDSVSGLLDRRTLITPIASALGIYVGAWMLLTGRHHRPLRARPPRRRARLLRRLGHVLLPFLRLGAGAAAAYWFLFAYVHEWLFARWYVNMTRDVAVEQTVFYWRC